MTLGLGDCLLREILGLGGGFLPLTLAFALLSLRILNLDGDLTRAVISAKGMASRIAASCSEASGASAGTS